MKRNGFTLIELLAVIVILAIIALIATPIILGIINDAREKANERSVELYASAVKNAMAAYQLTSPNAPESFSDLTVQYDGDVKCTVQELYEDGSFYLEGCKVNNGEKEYSYGTKQVAKGTIGICNPLNVQTVGTYTAGDKYECDVDPNKDGYDHTFYVLNSTSESVNLIMDRNICEDGTEATESNTCTYAWYADEKNHSNGPVTAIAKLNAATSKWDNVLSLNETYIDEGGKYGTLELKGKARLPYKSEIASYSASANNAYLYDNLEIECWSEGKGEEVSCDTNAPFRYGVFDDSITHIYNIYGYWTLSSYTTNTSVSYYAWEVNFRGLAESGRVDYDGSTGVRPVINLSI